MWFSARVLRRSSSCPIAGSSARRDTTCCRNLAQWGADVKSFCGALGIEKPIVYGASFGGMVALAYATRIRHIRAS